MATSSNDPKLKAEPKPKHQARERVATLVALSPTFGGDPLDAADLAILLGPQDKFSAIEPDDYLEIIYALQSRGLILDANAFQKKLNEYRASQEFQDLSGPNDEARIAGFVDYLLQDELGNYLGQSQDKNKGHTALYARMLDHMNNPPAVIDPQLKEDIQNHQKAVAFRQLRTRVEFFQQTNQELPARLTQLVQVKYPHWNPKDPLPNVNLKKRSKTRVEIDVDDLGVDLDQLLEIMNQSEKNITLAGESCHEKPNPFRAILFEKDGKYYTVGAAKDENDVFKVHAYECDMNGENISSEIADPAGWMSLAVTSPTDPAGMDLSDAVADALTKLAHYSKPSEKIDEVEEEENEEKDVQPEQVLQAAPIQVSTAPLIEGTRNTDQPEAVVATANVIESPQEANLVQAAKKLEPPLIVEVATPEEAVSVNVSYASRRSNKVTQEKGVLKDTISQEQKIENENVVVLRDILRKPVAEIKALFTKYAGLTDLDFNRLIHGRFERMEQPEKEKAISESSHYPEDALVRGAIRQSEGDKRGLETATKYPNRQPGAKGEWLAQEILLKVATEYKKEQPEVKGDTAAKAAKENPSVKEVVEKAPMAGLVPKKEEAITTTVEPAKSTEEKTTSVIPEEKTEEVKVEAAAATEDDDFGGEDDSQKKKVNSMDEMKKAIQAGLASTIGGAKPTEPLEKILKRPLADTLKAAAGQLTKNFDSHGIGKKQENKKTVEPLQEQPEEIPVEQSDVNQSDMGPPPPPPPPPLMTQVVKANTDAIQESMKVTVKDNKKMTPVQMAQEDLRKILDRQKGTQDEDENDDDFWNKLE
jgi:hypothetical protein